MIENMLMPIDVASPLEIWKTMAHSISAIMHKAARNVSRGLMWSSAGSIKPTAPRKSITPRSLTTHSGTCPVHGIISDIFAMGRNFITVPITKRVASNSCAAQSEIVIVFEGSFSFFIYGVNVWYQGKRTYICFPLDSASTLDSTIHGDSIV